MLPTLREPIHGLAVSRSELQTAMEVLKRRRDNEDGHRPFEG